MREVPATLQAAWREGLFVGDRKAVARVTVQHPQMALRHWNLLPYGAVTAAKKLALLRKTKIPALPAAGTKGYHKIAGQIQRRRDLKEKAKKVNQTYADFFFTHLNKPKELPNVQSVQWSRTTVADVADCTIVVSNTQILPPGQTPVAGEWDQPGYFTYDRGATSFGKARWGHTRNDWFGMLVPDNIIRTYEGYGSDMDVIPELDPYNVQTGVWLIDTVTMNADATMTIKCRDVGRILLDQMYYKPVIPTDWEAIGWDAWPDPEEVTTSSKVAGKKIRLTPQDSSNTPWIGSGTVQGHTLAAAFDGNPNTYWLSIGNVAPSRRFAYEWIQGKVGGQTISSVRFRTKKKGYTAYISLKVNGQWIGKKSINYHEDGIGRNDGDIAYYKSAPVDTEDYITVKFDPIAKVQAIRITLGNLQNFPGFGTYHYRGAIRDIEAYSSGTTVQKTTKGKKIHAPAGSNPGRYNDYTDIVKLLCAWGGFYWPLSGRQRLSDGTYFDAKPLRADTSVLGKGVHGRVWGDFHQSGVAGVGTLELDDFDQKPLMDGISRVRDLLGFLFHIDETGAVIWRLPNTFDYGCYRAATDQKTGYVKDVHVIDERSVLLSLSVVVDSKNVREGVFVGNVDGTKGAYSPGFNPNPTGLRRMSGWTDQNFASIKESQRMADMIALAQLFTYRTDTVRIPANPKMQIDDQVRILERTTAEGYVHYIKGISSSLDNTTGEWTYDLQTHWLGRDPKTKWLFYPRQQLHSATADYVEEATQRAKYQANKRRGT